jgi:hypothetical protein
LTYSTVVFDKGSVSGVRPKKSKSTLNRLASMPISRLIAVSRSLKAGASAKVAVATAYLSEKLEAAMGVYENPSKVGWSLVKISGKLPSVTCRGILEILKVRDLLATPRVA